MSAKVIMEGEFAVVHLEGEIDLSCASAVRKTILDQISLGQHTCVNLAQVSYIDSSGIASLVEGFQAAKKKGLQFFLIAVSEPVMSVLALARLDKVFSIHATPPPRH